MSYERRNETEGRLRKKLEALLAKAAATDEAEDAQYGKNGEELPAELTRRESRLKMIREAKADLEREAKEKAAGERAEAEAKIAERRQKEAQTGKKVGGYDPKVADPKQSKLEPKAQRNFIDPESRIMPDGANKGSFVQGCDRGGGANPARQRRLANDSDDSAGCRQRRFETDCGEC